MLTRVRVSSLFLGLMLFGFAGATSVVAQFGTTPAAPTTTTTTPTTTYTQTQVIEWDISSISADGLTVDGRPGAMSVDLYSSGGGKIWFTTRLGSPSPRVFMFQPPQNLEYGSAQWTSWTLNPAGAGTTGGLKKIKSSYDRRYVFVRTVFSVQKIDTLTDQRTTYCDTLVVANGVPSCDTNGSQVSDVAVDDRNNVYYTHNGVLQRLNASGSFCTAQPCPAAPGTQWDLNGSAPGGVSFAGICQGGPVTDPCLAGVAVHPKYHNLVYLAEPQNNTIAEVDTNCGNVRRWDVTQVGASQPRQINIDQDGLIWTVTGSGHLVSLDPRSSTMASYPIPSTALNDTFGVAPDGGMVGYTATNQGQLDPNTGLDFTGEHKVAMLVPRAKGKYVGPTPGMANPNPVYIQPICDQAFRDAGSIPGHPRTVNARITPDPSGTFVEAFINQNTTPNARTSNNPLGIAPDFDKAVGTFFYAVGQAEDAVVDRIGFARLPRKGLKGKHEREDKDFKDDGSGQDDEDHDGIPNRYKTNDSKADMDRQNDQLGPGQSSDYTMSTGPTTLAMVAAIQADNALEPVSVQIIDPNGVTLVGPTPTPGLAAAIAIPTTAGNYIVRVKNEGSLPINHETLLIKREPLSVP